MEKIYKLLSFLFGILLGRVIINYLNSKRLLIFNVPINKNSIKVNEKDKQYKIIIN